MQHNNDNIGYTDISSQKHQSPSPELELSVPPDCVEQQRQKKHSDDCHGDHKRRKRSRRKNWRKRRHRKTKRKGSAPPPITYCGRGSITYCGSAPPPRAHNTTVVPYVNRLRPSRNYRMTNRMSVPAHRPYPPPFDFGRDVNRTHGAIETSFNVNTGAETRHGLVPSHAYPSSNAIETNFNVNTEAGAQRDFSAAQSNGSAMHVPHMVPTPKYIKVVRTEYFIPTTSMSPSDVIGMLHG
mmetsp:Transcript_20531/g.32866  ORF Transcript_20531/g.32866 Transcript_20531/m.32866 type:complete len:239 (+) Transcript_20531:170-886(+)